MGDPRDPGRRRRTALIAALRRSPQRAGAAPSLRARLRRATRMPRQLRPTRAGWLFFGLVFGIGFAALNTGNNLLYLVLSMLLAFLVLSGVLSEAALRGIRVERRLPFEWVAGRSARVVLEISNAQRRSWAQAIVVEDHGRAPADTADRALGSVFALRIEPGKVETRSYRFQPDAARRAAIPRLPRDHALSIRPLRQVARPAPRGVGGGVPAPGRAPAAGAARR